MPAAKDDDGSSLIRDSPDVETRRGPTRTSRLWAIICILLELPSALIGSTFSYLSGEQPRWKSLPLTWLFALRKLASNHTIPTVDPLEWDQPPSPSSFLPEVMFGIEARRGMGCERVVVGPVSDTYIRGIAQVAQIKSVPRPGWMIWPAQHSGDGATVEQYNGGKGLEKARPDEKVLYYLVGG